MKLYIIGPVTGIEDNNKQAFLEASFALIEAGYFAGVPHSYIPSNAKWSDAMKVSIAHMMQADGVAMLPGWQNSRGASLEHEIALRLDMPLASVSWWIEHADDFAGSEEE